MIEKERSHRERRSYKYIRLLICCELLSRLHNKTWSQSTNVDLKRKENGYGYIHIAFFHERFRNRTLKKRFELEERYILPPPHCQAWRRALLCHGRRLLQLSGQRFSPLGSSLLSQICNDLNITEENIRLQLNRTIFICAYILSSYPLDYKRSVKLYKEI